jgi:hypothetical protein
MGDLLPPGWREQRKRAAEAFRSQEAGMDAEMREQLASIIALLVELRDRLNTLAEQLGVELD